MKNIITLIFLWTTPIILVCQIKQITYNDDQNYHPKWSSDQGFILFTSRDASNQPALKLFDNKNETIIEINTGKEGDHYTNWIPGTKRFFFDCLDESGLSLYHLNLMVMFAPHQMETFLLIHMDLKESVI